MPIFDNFFQKWSQMKTNEDKGMKPTLKGHNYTKFSYRERSSLLSHSSLEYMYLKGRTEVEVGDLIFCREIFPYLESSLPKDMMKLKSENYPAVLCLRDVSLCSRKGLTFRSGSDNFALLLMTVSSLF